MITHNRLRICHRKPHGGLARFLSLALLLLSSAHAAAEDAPPTKPLSADGARLLVSRGDRVKVITSELTEDAASVLAEHSNVRLVLEKLSVEVAERLAKQKGDMSIDVTRGVSEAAVESLKEHRGRLVIHTPFSNFMLASGDADASQQQEAASPPTRDAKAAIGAAQPRPATAPATTQTAAVDKLARFETECDEICSEMLAAYRAVSNSPRDIVVSAGEKLEELGRNPEKQMNGKGISAGCARATMTYLGMCSFISLEAAARCGGQELPDGGMVGMMDSMLSETDERLRGEGNVEEYWTHMALVRASIKLYANSNAFNSDFERQLIEGGAQPVVIHEMQRLRRDVLSLLKARYAAGIKYALGQYGAPPFSER